MAQRIRKKTFVFSLLFYCFSRFCVSDIDHNREAIFTKVDFHQLQGKVIQTKTVYDSFECSRSCLRFFECLSMNFAVLPNKDGLYECVLLRNEKSGSFELLQLSQVYHHFSRFVDYCSTPRCLNSGTCRAVFQGFRCNCPHGFTGNLCQISLSGKNCAKVLKNGGVSSGVYEVNPDSQEGPFKVYCDQTTTGGGWTVFQRRQEDGDFYLGWDNYKKGFGNLTANVWLGLDKIYRLTNQTRNRFRVELADWEGNSAYAEYDYFAVANENNNYALSLGNYSGTAGDSLTHHRGMAFTTKDRDNDKNVYLNCAVKYKGAWWYNSCRDSNLNGLYHHGVHASDVDGVHWKTWKGYKYSVKKGEMKIRPV